MHKLTTALTAFLIAFLIKISNKKLNQIVSKLITLISHAVLFCFAHVEHFCTFLEDIINTNYKPLKLEQVDVYLNKPNKIDELNQISQSVNSKAHS